MKTTLLITLLLLSLPAVAAEKLHLIVMDPLSKDLACACVQGYAQRNYETLASWLQRKTGMEVKVTHGETLAEAVKEAGGVPALIIGKDSVVRSEAARNQIGIEAVAALTGKDGSTSQQGLIVVRKDSTARSLADLAGSRIYFGPGNCEEKSAAAIAVLEKAGVSIPEKKLVSDSCSTAAKELMALDPGVKAAAVISSYAQPLLSGCGTIEKGDLVVIGKTEDVPFITAFANASLPKETRHALTEALLDTGSNARLLEALESLVGFVELPAGGTTAWNQFRGSRRDGTVPWLPDRLPAEARYRWRKELPSDGVGGVAATADVVIVSSRDSLDEADCFFVWTPARAVSAGGSNMRHGQTLPWTMATVRAPHPWSRTVAFT